VPQLEKTVSPKVLTTQYEIDTKKSHKILQTRVFDHLEKSSSLLSDINKRIAAKKATIKATTNKKPANTKKMLKSRFLNDDHSRLDDNIVL
jgi:hypothetical protein